MTEREEPLRCLVKFTSTNLLESFRQCASLGKNFFSFILNIEKNVFRRKSGELMLVVNHFEILKLLTLSSLTTRGHIRTPGSNLLIIMNLSWRTDCLVCMFLMKGLLIHPPCKQFWLFLLCLSCFVFVFLLFIGIASTPVTPLLSSILLKGRNHFVITDNGPGLSSQTRQQQNWWVITPDLNVLSVSFCQCSTYLWVAITIHHHSWRVELESSDVLSFDSQYVGSKYCIY